MAGYESLQEAWTLEVGEEEWNGTRVLMRKTGAPDSVPDIDDQFPQSEADELVGTYTIPSGLVLRRKRVKVVGEVDGGNGVETWTCSYSTRPLSGFDLRPEDEPDSLSVGSESIVLENEGTSAGMKEEGGDPITDDIVVTIPVATYSQVKVYTTLSAAISSYLFKISYKI